MTLEIPRPTRQAPLHTTFPSLRQQAHDAEFACPSWRARMLAKGLRVATARRAGSLLQLPGDLSDRWGCENSRWLPTAVGIGPVTHI